MSSTMREFLNKALNETKVNEYKFMKDAIDNESQVEEMFKNINSWVQDIFETTGRVYKLINSTDKKLIQAGDWKSDFKKITSTMTKIDALVTNLYKQVDLK